jgi:hypothetical protein
MPLFPRRRKQPDPAPTAPADASRPETKARGGSGRLHTGGFLDYDELNPQLRGKMGIRAMEKMWRSDADVRRSLALVTTPAATCTFEVDPFVADDADGPSKEDEEAADFVRWALMDHMNPNLPSHAWTAMTVAGRAGFAPFETLWELTEWRGRPVWTYRTLDLRRPQSIDRWVQEEDRLIALEQFVPGGQGMRSATIPIEDLVYYRVGAEGDNWEGQSLLRPAYKHWKFKDGIELIEAMGIERWAIGVPIAYPPNGANDDDLDAVEEALEGIRANEQGFIVAPGPHAQYSEKGEGWVFDTLNSGSTGEGSRVKAALDHHATAIDAAVIAEFMRLGQKTVGARATADVQQNPFWLFCEALMTTVLQDAINTQLIPSLVDKNFTVKGMPKLRASLIDSSSLVELSEYVTNLGAAGFLTGDPTTERFLRAKADLPEISEDAMHYASTCEDPECTKCNPIQPPAAVDPVTGKPTVGPAAKVPPRVARPAKAGDDPTQLELPLDEPIMLARQDREMRSWEQVMSLDAIEGAIDGARDRFVEAGSGPARQMAVALSRMPRPRHTPVPEELVAVLASQLAALNRAGRGTVQEELRRQAMAQTMPGHLMLDDGPIDSDDLDAYYRDQAQDAAEQVQADILATLRRARLIRGADDATLQAAAESAVPGALKRQAVDRASGALNDGRTAQADELAADIEGSRYTSILDGRRCTQCAIADDDILRALDDPVRLARIPPNPSCAGGPACRCMEFFQLRTEQAPAA